MSSLVFKWRTDGRSSRRSVVEPRQFRPTSLAALEAADRQHSHGEPFQIHHVFAAHVEQVLRIPHRYAHLFVTRTVEGIEGEGSSQHAQTALQNSVFEALERTLATRYDRANLVSSTYAALRPKAVDPRELVLMSDWEHRQAATGYVQFHERLPLHWSYCWEITQGALNQCLIPATLAILRFSWKHPRERFAASLSAGIASGPTYAGALLHATYELIERDAFMIAWLRRRSCRRILVPVFDSAALSESYQRLTRDGFEVAFVDLTNDIGVPAFLTVVWLPKGLRVEGGFPAFGLGANLDPRKALSRSYAEALELMVNGYDFGEPNSIRVRRMRSTKRGFRLRQYYDDIRFLWSSGEASDILRGTPTRFDGPWSEFRTCVTRLASIGVKMYFADLTPPDLSAQRYKLVRVFASRLQPHLYEWDSWRLDNERLYQTPPPVRRTRQGAREAALNLAPNPYTILEHVRLD